MDSPENKTAFRASLALIWSRRFGPFLACSFLSNIGTWMQMVAEPWLLLKLSGSSFLVGLDSFMMNGPILLLIFLGGALADKKDRRDVILFFQSIQMLCPLILVVLLLSNTLSPWMVVALSLVVGITDALSMPAYQSMVPLIVRREELGRAIALNSADFNLARVVGPALGGWMMMKYGPLGCFSANAASYVPFIAAAFLVLPSRGPKTAAPAMEVPEASAFGVYFNVLRQPRMRGALGAVLLMSFFCGPLLAFSAVMVSSVLHGDVGEFGNSMAAFGLGGLLGAGLLLFANEKTDQRKICSVAAVLYGLTLVGISFTHSANSLRALMTVAGSLMAIGAATANTTLQQAASQHHFGRAAGLYMLFMRGGMALGNLWAGFVVSKFGIVNFLFWSGSLAAVFQLANFATWANHSDQPSPTGTGLRKNST
ncbi:MAG: MFS transporter [Bdellovibrionota bacterium]